MKKKFQFHYLHKWKKHLFFLSFVFFTSAISSQVVSVASNNMDSQRFQYNYQKNDKKELINIDIQNASIQELLNELGNSSKNRVVYDKSILDYRMNFTINEKNISLNDLLNKISHESNLRFKHVNNNINVRLAGKNSESNNVVEKPVDVIITGTVVGEDGTPLIGVSVIVEGTSTGTVTDFDGKYSLSVPEGASLVFSYVGMRTKTVAVGSSSTVIDVVLEEDVSALDAIVVVGYGIQKKSDITGAISVVGSEEFEDEPNQQVGQALQGKIAGLQVTANSGAPGAGLLIRVRGTGTVNNADPLYVVDGNPNVDPIDLAPDQIESVQVLKSASAAAIYGAQGANGVILITTKQGKAGKSTLNIDYSTGLQQMQRYVPMANATQYAILYNEGFVAAGQPPLYDDPESLGVGTDWQREITRVAPMTNITISSSGGSETSRYFFSTGYSNQEGIVKGSAFKRLNLRINSSHDVLPVLTVGQNLSASLSKSQNAQGSALPFALTANPEVPAQFPDGSWGYSPTSLNSYNPAADIFYNHDNTKRSVVNGNVFAELTVLKDFVIRSQYNFNIGFSERTNFNPAYNISPQSFYLIADLTEQITSFTEYSFANTITYNKTIGNHNFDVLAGVTTQVSDRKFTQAEGAGLPDNATGSEALRYLDLVTQGANVAGNAGSYGIFSYLGRLNYSYDNKYFATVNFRADGSSKFGKNNKWGYFPSFSLGWKISEENFMENVDWMNNLMLRAGWGQIGNQSSLPNYAFASLIEPNINYAYGSPQVVVRGQAPIGIGNPDLKWESLTETNIGFDFRGFNGKVTATFDWYNRETSDMLLQVPLLANSGIQNFPYVNGGNVTNKGFEIMVGYENTTSGGLKYGISVNMARNRNEVTALSNSGSAIFQSIGFAGQASVTQVGSPIASFWGWQTDGIFNTQAEVDAHAFQTAGTAPGDFRFKDLNNDGVINADDQSIIGNPWPKITYGGNLFLSFKSFDFSLNFQGVYGNDIFNATKFRIEGASFYGYSLNAWENRWTSAEETPNATVPRMNTGDPNNNFRSSDYYLNSGSYLRIRNIQLSYKLPDEIFNKIGGAKVSIYGSVQNAFTFTKYPFLDPEIGQSGGNSLRIGQDGIQYPVPRIYTIGVKIGF